MISFYCPECDEDCIVYDCVYLCPFCGSVLEIINDEGDDL